MKKLYSIILAISFSISACGTTKPQNLSSVETSTLISNPTATKNYVLITPTITSRLPIPTLSINAEQKMVEVLKSNDCKLPCYIGIVPGKTKLSDAKLILESLGATFLGENTRGEIKDIGYLAVIDDPSITATNGGVENHRVSNSIGLVVIDDVVQQTFIWVLGRGLSPKFQDYWSRYTPNGVFLQIGVPDDIYSASGLLALVYKDIGIINMYETFWKDGQLCPQHETGYFDRRFEITNPDSPVEIFSEHQKSLKSVWKPIEESLGVSVQEFYDQVMTDDSVCFDIKIK